MIDLDTDPDGWWRAVYSNTAIITQRNDGLADVADTHAYPTSSLSSPHVVAEMLDLLDIASHHQVLGIGAGSGWTDALLAWRLGDDQVTTVEIDEYVAARASANYKAAGYLPTLLIGDGTRGAPDGAPYDRMHVTCGVRNVPYEWIEQTRPGGSIVLPWMPMPGQWGYQLRLDVLDDGVAVGRFHGDCGFMMLRSQRVESWPPYADTDVKSTSRLDPREPAGALDRGFALHLAALAPHLTITAADQEDDGWGIRLRDLTGPASRHSRRRVLQ
ncbi:methyltransferase [Nonomuraea sp. NPDC049637]|uniref:methyltransferase n=1 Tax=Nonomuraea sp. NPDC049637 TaxID=3154356 RepID=UPI00342F1358